MCDISAQLSCMAKRSRTRLSAILRAGSGVAAHDMRLRLAVMPAWPKKYFGESDIDPTDWDVR
jgi:hypothetical protein